MEASIHFLLRWRRIFEDEGREWLTNYLHSFNAYMQPGVNFDDLDALEFDMPNSKKTNKAKFNFAFPPNFFVKKPNDILEVIIVYWKHKK